MVVQNQNPKIILDCATLAEHVRSQQSANKRVVMTNGCFDILHYGHVTYLKEARKRGDLLLVALNTNRSVQRIKGPSRPINGERERLEVLSALEFVDLVTLFDEETPYELIKNVLPNVLVEGGDWPVDKIVGGGSRSRQWWIGRDDSFRTRLLHNRYYRRDEMHS